MSKLKFIIKELLLSFCLIFPNTSFFNRLRVRMYRKMGFAIDKNASISANVRLRGKIQIGEHSSIAQNCSLSGANAGIIIKNYVMIAPNCVLVAFDHGFNTRAIPMLYQEFFEEEIIIEDDVWIGANCVITKGAHIKKGAIVAANSVVVGTVDSYAIYGGSPAKLIKYRPE